MFSKILSHIIYLGDLLIIREFTHRGFIFLSLLFFIFPVWTPLIPPIMNENGEIRLGQELLPNLDIWTPQKQIPGFANSTYPPKLVTGKDGIVYAFSSQIYQDAEGATKMAIFFSEWTAERGWSEPYDIFVAPGSSQIFLTDARMDDLQIIHIIFLIGNNTNANIYYSRANAKDAYNSNAWLAPIIAGDSVYMNETAAALAMGYRGDFMILFSGYLDGAGIYMTSSSDGGETWIRPVQIYLTNKSDLLPYGITLSVGQSGIFHAIWNVITNFGQGRMIYYSNFGVGSQSWSIPIKISEVQSGYGTNSPNVIEYGNKVFAIYNVTPKLIMRISADEGQTWDNPTVLFSRFTGVNGSIAPIIDRNDELHLFFGQRISGNPDIHGLWHSTWLGAYWSEPEAIISGPRIMAGVKSFDPFEAHAVVTEKNYILVTWRTDPGNDPENENSVWYSFSELDPGQSQQNGGTPVTTTPTLVQDTVQTSIQPSPTSTQSTDKPYDFVPNPTDNNQLDPLVLGIAPTVLLIIVILIRSLIKKVAIYKRIAILFQNRD